MVEMNRARGLAVSWMADCFGGVKERQTRHPRRRLMTVGVVAIIFTQLLPLAPFGLATPAASAAEDCTVENQVTTSVGNSSGTQGTSIYVPANRKVEVRMFGSATEKYYWGWHRLQSNPVVTLTGPGTSVDHMGLIDYYHDPAGQAPHTQTFSHARTWATTTAGTYQGSGHHLSYYGDNLQQQVSIKVLVCVPATTTTTTTTTPPPGGVPLSQWELAGPNGGLIHGDSCWLGCGDPISTRTGAFYDAFTDLDAIPGRSPMLAFTRTYLSARSGTVGPFGAGWSHNWKLQAISTTGQVEIRQESGASVFFTSNGSGGYTAPARVYGTLSTLPGGGWRYVRGTTERFDFDAAGKLVAAEDLDGDRTTLTYNGSNQLTSITDSAGRKIQLTWSAGRIATVKDPSTPPRVVTYGYTGGLLTSVTDVAGGITTFGYDGSSRIVTVRDPRHNADGTGLAVTNVYDAQGRVTRQTDEAGEVFQFDYTTVANATIVTKPSGTKVSHQYDANGLLVSVTDGYGSATPATTTYTRDQNHLGIKTITDPLGKVTTNTYDAAGDLLSVTDPLGRTTTITYNALDLPLTVTDPSGVTTTATYTAQGRLLSTSRPLKNDAGAVIDTATTTFTYDPTRPEDVKAVTDPEGHVWSFSYDTHGNQISSTAPATGAKTTVSYNTLGWPIAVTAPLGNVAGAVPGAYTSTTTYDALGRVTATTAPDGIQTSVVYDPNGNVIRSTDGEGHMTSTTYDPIDRPIQVVRADGTLTSTSYKPGGGVATITDPGGAITTYDYDTLGRRTKRTDALGRATTYTHDLAGRIKTVTAADGTVATLNYDSAGQLISTTGVTSSYSYDSLGRPVTRTDAAGVTRWKYDSLGRMTAEYRDGADNRIDYGYDLVGNLTSIDYPGPAGTVTRNFNGAGQMTRMQDWQFREFLFTYDANGSLIRQTNPNGTITTATVSEAGTVDAIHHDGLSRVANAPIARFGYTRDDNRMVTDETATGVPGILGPSDFGYDPLGQLTDVDSSAFGYDDADDLVFMLDGGAQEYDAAHQLTKKTAPITRVASLSAADQANNTVTLAYGGLAAGNDVAVVAVASPSTESGAPTGTGWTLTASKISGNTHLAVYTKVLTTNLLQLADIQTVQVNFSGTGRYPKAVGASLYRGVDTTTTPMVAASTTNGAAAASSVTAGSLSADARLSTRIVAAAEVGSEATKTGPWSGPSNVQVHGQTIGAAQVSLAFADDKRLELGPTGALTMTYPVPADLAAISLVLRPAPIRYTYDQRGNRTARTPSSGTATAYTYDSGNRLTGVDATTTYAYDAGGLRVSKTVDPPGSAPAVTTKFVWTTNSGLPLLLSAGDRHFLYGPTGQVVAAVDPLPEISYVGGQTITASDSPTLAVPLPALGAKYDVAVLTSTFPSNQAVHTTPAGYSEVARKTSGLTTTVVWVRTLTGNIAELNDPAATVVYSPGTYSKTLSVAVYRNVDPFTPVTATTTAGALNASSVSTGTLTSTNPLGSWAVMIASTNDPTGPTSPTINVAGATSRRGSYVGLGSTQPYTVIADAPIAGLGSTTLTGTYNDVGDLTGIGLVLQHAPPRGHFYHADQIGSIRAVTDEYAELKAARSYDPYGTPMTTNTPQTGANTVSAAGATVTLGSSISVSNDFGFAGEWTDGETGFVYLRARYYDPTTNQFITEDPLVDLTREPYGYASNRPTHMTDPTGLWPWDGKCVDIGALVGPGSSKCNTIAEHHAAGARALGQSMANAAGGTLNGLTLGHGKGFSQGLSWVGLSNMDERVRWESDAARRGTWFGTALQIPFALKAPQALGYAQAISGGLNGWQCFEKASGPSTAAGSCAAVEFVETGLGGWAGWSGRTGAAMVNLFMGLWQGSYSTEDGFSYELAAAAGEC